MARLGASGRHSRTSTRASRSTTPRGPARSSASSRRPASCPTWPTTQSPFAAPGYAGSGTQAFAYDALSRLTGSSGLAGVARTYAYDLDGNRVAFTLGSDTYQVTFDRTDAATGTRKNGGASVAFAWDRWGNLLADASAGTTAGLVTYGYDLADRTTSITRAGTTTSLALDALGRPRTRTTGASVDTMTYEGATNTVLRVANAGGSGTTTDGITDARGTRLGTRRGSSVAWLTPDLHGSVAAGLVPAATAISDA